MRKLMSLLLAVVMVMSLATVAFAAKTDDYEDKIGQNITFTKNYVVNAGQAPAETFDFSEAVFKKFVNNENKEVTSASQPTVTVGDAVFNAAMDAQEDAYTATVSVAITNFQNCALGEYYYEISEVDPEVMTAGGNYEATPVTLVVTVLRDTQQNINYVAAILYDAAGDKIGGTTNTYDAGTLAITKTVTGNMGDREKDFTFTVKFEAEEGYAIKSAITYNDGEETATVPESGEVTITLKHGSTVTFNNVPYDVTYTVTETEDPNYETSYKVNNGTAAEGLAATDEMDTAAETVEFINDRSTGVETGIITDSAPYIILIAVCALAAVLFVTKRRSVEF